MIGEIGDRRRRAGFGAPRRGDRVDHLHILELRRQSSRIAASAPRAFPYVGAPDVEQAGISGYVAHVIQRAVAHGRQRARDSKRTGFRAPSAAPSAPAGKYSRMIGEALARQQKLNHVAAIFDVDAALAEQPVNLVDSKPRVVAWRM